MPQGLRNFVDFVGEDDAGRVDPQEQTPTCMPQTLGVLTGYQATLRSPSASRRAKWQTVDRH